jgi:rare lipoprotein A
LSVRVLQAGWRLLGRCGVWGLACVWGVVAAAADVGAGPDPEADAPGPRAEWAEPTETPVAAAAVQSWGQGKASWYSHRFVGKRTASGEPYRKEVFSAAHRSLPLGALVTVRNPANQREVVVRINDRGPHHPGREIDLSHAAAQALGVARHGVATVEWQLAPPGARVTAPLRAPKATKVKPKPRHKAAKPGRSRR